MNILIMGEESQEICKALRAKGHNAFSCDIQDCSGGHPEWHIKGDMWKAFDNSVPTGGMWDMVIVHIVCTFMCNSGALRLYKGGKKANGICEDRWRKMVASTEEFKRALALPCKKIALENPVMHCHAKRLIGVNQSQTIQPYQFGHSESKRTCLWLKGLPLLKPTNILPLPECGHWDNQTPSGQNKLAPSATRGKERSKTYTGWAQAMAEQWG